MEAGGGITFITPHITFLVWMPLTPLHLDEQLLHWLANHIVLHSTLNIKTYVIEDLEEYCRGIYNVLYTFLYNASQTSEDLSSVAFSPPSSVELAPHSCVSSGILSGEQRVLKVVLLWSVILPLISPNAAPTSVIFPSASLHKIDLDSSFRSSNKDIVKIKNKQSK